uniref:Retrovirus-related Pol polyprotein from transposon TNT 1-94 n=1 Tax=Tanacetum cinerariifolium TaxID=118510 RepID=A0A6L2M805_TANCI|nr:retrovirus-related Pol polyprotein from transposon TNT 1-94 [Tanacetum cinerariifolium]
MWMRKGPSNTIKADLSFVNHSNLNKNVKRYSRKNLVACNNSDTYSAFDCNNARNALCNAIMNASVDVNDLFVFDDVSIRKSHVSKMSFRKKPSTSLNVPSRSNSSKYLPRTVHRWLSKLQPLAEPVAKWIPKVNRQIDKISKTSNSSAPIYKWVPKHMTGNRALLTNFVEKFLGTVRFGNNDFAMIAGYRDIHRKHHKSKMAFASNKPLYLLHMDLCGPMHVERINGKRYVLVVVDDYPRYTWDVGKFKVKVDIGVFVGYSKESAAFRIYNKQTQEVGVPSSNTQSVSKHMIPNVDKASTLHNVFNERLEDAYFNASTSFHDLSNVHTFYQPYPHEKKWTKDHPLHKIISDLKSSVRTRGQQVNSCLQSSIEPANVAEGLRDANWVSAMQDELD